MRIDLIRAEKDDQAPVVEHGKNHEHVIGAKISNIGKFESHWKYLGSKEISPTPCDIASYMPRDVPWGTTTSGEGKAHGIACRFDRDYFVSTTGIDDTLSQNDLVACRNIYGAGARNTLHQIYDEVSSPGISSVSMVESLANILLIEFSRQFFAGNRVNESSSGFRQTIDLREIYEIIYNARNKKVTVRDISAHLGYSEGHFHKIFKEKFELTPHAYIDLVNRQRCIDLLSHESASIKQIAHALGFSSQSSFSAAFLRLTGMSPAKFRREGNVRQGRPRKPSNAAYEILAAH